MDRLLPDTYCIPVRRTQVDGHTQTNQLPTCKVIVGSNLPFDAFQEIADMFMFLVLTSLSALG